MTINQQTIGGYAGSNVPGVLNLYLFDRKNTLSVLDPFRHRIPGTFPSMITAGSFLLHRGTLITKMKFPPLACSYVQTLDRIDGGLISKNVVQFSVPASRRDISDFYNENFQKQFVCLLEDANRKAYVLGNEERGMMMSIAQSINTVNAHTITLLGNFNYPTLYIEISEAGLVLADHFRDTDFSIDLSLDFNA